MPETARALPDVEYQAFRTKVAFLRRSCNELVSLGVPEEAVDPIREFIGTLGCESCGAPATSGPHGEDSVYLCDDCLEIDLAEQQTVAAIGGTDA